MAVNRPWVTPQEVKDYSDYVDVQQRADNKLRVDISRAEQVVISYTHNRFDDEALEAIPEGVKTAVILLAERYAHTSYKVSREYKSETLDDWSYTANDTEVSIADLGISALLDEYVLPEASGALFMRLRKL